MITAQAGTLVGFLEVDGKKHRIEGKQFQLEVSEPTGAAALGGGLQGRTVTESVAISGDKLVTSVTDRNGGSTVTTTTTSDSSGSTTTTTTSDGSGSSTTIKIDRK